MTAFADVVKRRNHQDLVVKKSIEEREPALINLPIPLPDVGDIPVVGPILDPVVSKVVTHVVGGNNPPQTHTTTHGTSPTTQPADPTQTPKTTPTTTPQTTPTDPTNPPSTGSGDNTSSHQNDPTGSDNGSSGTDGPTRSRELNAGNNPTQFPSHDDVNSPNGPGSTHFSTIFSNGTPIGTSTIVGAGPATDMPTSPGGGDGGGGDNGNGNGNGDGKNPAGANSPKVSGGVIAAIAIVAAMILIAIFIIIRRRRYIAKRTEQRAQWWNQAKKDAWSGSASLEATAGTQSARSSFATTFDHASHIPESQSATPPLPPMAELRDDHASGFILHSQPQSPIQVLPTPALISFDVPADSNDRRNSTFSTRSNGSDGEGQYLVAPVQSTQPTASPISVRPFSPSESYSFPKPPPSATLVVTPAANETTDPFKDPVKDTTEPWTPLFFGKEIVRRPFAPTLHDEIAVSAGETVRVSKVFDDGWALIEKCPVDENSNDKGKKKQVMGLIPIDCLREPGQDLSTFLASTRLSSYSAIPETSMGKAM